MPARKVDVFLRLRSRTQYEDAPEGLPGQCWIYTGGTSGRGRGGGYGRIWYVGVTWAAHILSFVLHGGIRLPYHHIAHKCHRRLCWNPDHLEQTTQSENEKAKGNRWNLHAPNIPARDQFETGEYSNVQD